MKLFLLTLKDSILQYQGRKRLQIEDRKERNSFNAFRHLSAKLGYKDETSIYKMINQSTSRVKMGVDDLSNICVEIMDASPIEDLLNEVREEITRRKELVKSHYQEQLHFLE